MIPYIRAANVKDGYLALDSVLEMNFTPKEQAVYCLGLDDVLVTEGCGSPLELGASAVWRGEIAGPVGFQNHVLRLRARPGSSDARFLGHLARWCHHSGRWREVASGTSILNIGLGRARKVQVPTPDVPTQARIGEVLGSFDELIANNRRRIEILEEVARSLYREWFVHYRFPGHESTKFVDSPLGLIPEVWKTARLSTLVTTQYGYTESAHESDVGPKYLRGTDINKRSYIDWSLVPYCPIGDESLAKFRVALGDVFVIRMADPGKVGICEEEVEAVFASYLVRMRPRTEALTPYFLFFTLSDERYQRWITGASTGSTRKSASAKVMTEPVIVLPSSEPLQTFDGAVKPIRSLMAELTKQNAAARRVRDALLPRLVTGQVEVESLGVDDLFGWAEVAAASADDG